MGAAARDNLDPQAPRVVPWDFAGLLLTYWCNARCAFCYTYSDPSRGGEMSIETAVRLWRELEGHAARHGRAMRVHLAGGEPFGDWPRLAGVLRAARDAGLVPPDKVETNAFWARDDALVRARLELLAALDVERLIVSSDVFHQEFVPIERVRRLVAHAREVLGRGRVRVRWWDYFNEPYLPENRSDEAREAAYRRALERHHDRMTGRAAEQVADLLPLYPAEHFGNETCARELLAGRHVHIDARGHVFPGTCSGIIVGTAAEGRTVDDVWQGLADGWQSHPVQGPLITGGSRALMDVAARHGYRPRPQGYASKCHLCAHVRQFLFDRGLFPETIGPAECYAPTERPVPLTASASPET